ncbi:E3 ubiquitin-protein ligase [Entamoeba marina]
MISTSSEKNLFDLLFDGNSAKSALDKCKDLLHTKICRNCGSVNEKNILYRCLTCGILEESCICAECFKNGNHEGHQYFACTCLTSFTCDCGNEKLWKPEGFCKYHGHQQDCDPIDLISNIYPNFINTTRDIYLHVGSVLNEQNNVNSVDIFFSALKEISSCDLFFVVMGTLLNENIPLDWKCELRTIVNEKNISFAEYFFEYIFLHPFESIPRCLWSFMTNFATEVDLFTFPLYRIYDMILLTAKQPFSNEKALDFVGQHFLISNDNATLELCNTHRLEDSLISLQNVLKQNMKEEIPITIARNAQNILFFFQTRLGPTPSVSPTLLKTYLNTLSICSNLFPNLIKEGEHASYDSPYFKRVSWAIFVGSLSDKLLLVFKPEYLQTHFLEIHEMVMEHIHTYLTDVPRISINETSFSYRVCGKNQPVSPSSPLITFYTKVLLQLIYSGYDITIPQQDAALLVESVLLSLCFKEQITNDVWKRNGDEVLYQHFFYVSLYTSDCLLYDLTLLQILVPLISPNTFALSLAFLTQQNTTTNGHSTEENEQVSQQLLRLLAGLADAQVVNDANQDDNDAPLIQQDGVDGIIARINEIVERLNEERYEDQQTVSSLLDDNTNQEKEVNEEQKVNKDIVVEMQFEEFIQSYLKYDTKAISSFLRIIVEICRNPNP